MEDEINLVADVVDVTILGEAVLLTWFVTRVREWLRGKGTKRITC